MSHILRLKLAYFKPSWKSWIEWVTGLCLGVWTGI